MEALTRFTGTRFMLVEGDDDRGFFESLIEVRGLPQFQICHAAQCNAEKVGGKTGFPKALRGFEPLSGFRDLRAILVVLDNDAVGPSFAAAQRFLTDNGYRAPTSVDGVGELAGKPVAILMIPRSDMVGDLELLVLPAIHEKWPQAAGCVDSFLRCTGADRWTKPASLRKARARSATVGFNEDDPFKGIGHLCRNRTLSVMHPCFDEVANFLRNFDVKVGI